MLTHTRSAAPPVRTVVVGHHGFVGSAVAAQLEALGWPWSGFSSQEIDLTADGAGDALAEQLRPGDALVTTAALTPDRGKDIRTLERNVRMSRHIAEAITASPVAHLVYVGSDAVYADDVHPVRESSCAAPSTLYGAMHLTRELGLGEACRAQEIPLALLRPTLIFGPGDTHNAYGPNRFIRTAGADGEIRLFGEGEERRDHVFVHDVARLIARVLERGASGTLNVATGRSASFREVAEDVAELTEQPVTIIGTPRKNPVTHRHFDVAATQGAFPSFAWTPLRVGLQQTIEVGID